MMWNTEQRERKTLSHLFPDACERAVFARLTAARRPDLVRVDLEMLPWVKNEETGAWFSFDGSWSKHSPEERAQRFKDDEDEIRRRFIEYEVYSKIRQSVLERDGYSCRCCGAKKPTMLHVHHILKRRLNGPDTLDNLIVVCPSCHKKAEGKRFEDWSNDLMSRPSIATPF